MTEPRPSGPDGFVAQPDDPLRPAHQRIDSLLNEAREADDPHHCRIGRLESFEPIRVLVQGSAGQLPIHIRAALQRIWRIEELGPRALDEGGVRGWNSIGWLDHLLRELLHMEVDPQGEFGELDPLILELEKQGENLFSSRCSRVPELSEWIAGIAEGSTGTLGAEACSALEQMAARFGETPPTRNVWKEKHLRRILSAFRSAIRPSQSRGTGDTAGKTGPVAGPGRASSNVDGGHSASPVTGAVPPSSRGTGFRGIFIDRRLRGQRMLQQPLAHTLRQMGWSYRLQGAWDPPPSPSRNLDGDSPVGDGVTARLTLRLGERETSDLLDGGSCRYVTIEELALEWPLPPDPGTPRTIPLVPLQQLGVTMEAILNCPRASERREPS